MRRLAGLFALFLLASCASQTQPRAFSVQVFEQRGRMRQATLNGQHAFVVRITNRSEEPVAVDSIEINPQTTSQQFYENTMAVDELLQPGETRDVTMWISVNVVASSYSNSIDGVDVYIAARSQSRGDFTETIGASVIGQ